MSKALRECQNGGTLARGEGLRRRFVGLPCDRWDCDECFRYRKARAIRTALGGKPTKLLTLTVREGSLGTAAEARRQLPALAATFLRQVARRLGWSRIDYFDVAEPHESGYPHLHVMLRCLFIDQRILSDEWQAITGSFRVDIRKIHGRRGAAKYVAKYMAKDFGQFPGFKRYWRSLGWLNSRRRRDRSRRLRTSPYKWLNRHVADCIAEQEQALREVREILAIGHDPPRKREPRRALRLKGGFYREVWTW